ncbi:MAG: VOC family protein [Devosia nanyangense]|uniref:VOC family protein n=1 Tax=Devosia nanyangense TaxID=1228055 RepID=A0A933NXA9_9HYPH|nr:VOC family protein [Devosia nanyangense]
MAVRVAMTTLVVDDYDRGIAFYRDALGLALIADTDLGGGKRWVVLGAAAGARLLLAKADGERQRAAIGNQTGGRVGFFLETDDFARDHADFITRGVTFREAPRYEAYGTVAVFEDPFGNGWDLIEPKTLGDMT